MATLLPIDALNDAVSDNGFERVPGVVYSKRAVPPDSPVQIVDVSSEDDAGPFSTLLGQMTAKNEAFAFGSVVLAKALEAQRRIIIAANLNRDALTIANLTCWHCQHDERGIDLRPIGPESWSSPDILPEPWADTLIGAVSPGDALIVCNPWGDHDLLWWALRTAVSRNVATIAITPDVPNLLAISAHYAIRVPVVTSYERETTVTVLQHLVHSAWIGMTPFALRADRTVRPIMFD